jgi:peroxiredoxin
MINLGQQLEAYYGSLLDRVDKDTAALLRKAEEELAASHPERNALRPGNAAPDFILPDQCGTPIHLADRLAQGPVVLLFVRGGWCPYCTLTLRAFQGIEPKLRKMNASLLALTPQKTLGCASTAERDLLRFPLLSDRNNQIAGRYGVMYELPEVIRPFYLRLGHDLPKINGTGDWRIPLPATFVIDQAGRIVAAQVSHDSHRRMEPAKALEVVRGLGAQVTQPASA